MRAFEFIVEKQTFMGRTTDPKFVKNRIEHLGTVPTVLGKNLVPVSPDGTFSGEKVTMVSFPKTGSQYQSFEEMLAQGAEDVSDYFHGKLDFYGIQWVNSGELKGPNAKKFKAFAITPVADSKDPSSVFWIGKFLKNTSFAKNFGFSDLSHWGYQGAGQKRSGVSVGDKAFQDMKPNTLGLAGVELSPQQLLQKLSQTLGDSPFVDLAKLAISGQPLVIDVAGSDVGIDDSLTPAISKRLSLIAKDFGEVLQPLAYASGLVRDASVKLSAPVTVNYTAASGTTYDGMVQDANSTVYISTKLGGTAPYVSGLAPMLAELPDDIKQKYAAEADILEYLSSLKTADFAPGNSGKDILVINERLGILSKESAEYVRRVMFPNRAETNIDGFKDIPQELRSRYDRLRTNERKKNFPVYCVIVKFLAEDLAIELNRNPRMSNLIKALLSGGSVITVNTSFKAVPVDSKVRFSLEFDERRLDSDSTKGSLTIGAGIYFYSGREYKNAGGKFWPSQAAMGYEIKRIK